MPKLASQQIHHQKPYTIKNIVNIINYNYSNKINPLTFPAFLIIVSVSSYKSFVLNTTSVATDRNSF